MSRTSTRDDDPHLYETLDESQFRIRLLETLDAGQGIMDSKAVRKKTKVPLKEQLCTAVLIAMVTGLVVSNVTLVLLFSNATSGCTVADEDDCKSQPCLHGSCSDRVNGYNCTCLRGYTGINCETDINDCATVDCGNGTCIDGVGNYTCACNFGFSGRFCEQNEDDCRSQPCLHGMCSDHVNGYNCTCLRGYTGINCETDIDDCATVDCGNGTCIDGVGNYTCACNLGFSGRHCGPVITDCYALYHYYGQRTDGVYTIITWKRQERVDVYCDMTTDSGGWTVFQYRFNGTVDFDRNFSEYDNGFGNLNTEFWLGLRYIQEIASQKDTDLRIDVEASNGTKGFEEFEKFRLSPGPNYTLYLGQTINSLTVSSNYSFGACHNGSKFSTCDHEVNSANYDCAEDFRGFWRYNMHNCSTVNLNGQYVAPGTNDSTAMVYDNFLFNNSLKSSRMMMRRRNGEI